MVNRKTSVHTSEEGQSLVLILVVIVIGAVIAFAIAARTVQDIRRTSQERISDQAGTQVETYLDGISSQAILAQLVDEDFNFLKCDRYEGTGNSICVLEGTSAGGEGLLNDLFGELECEEAEVKLRKVDGGIENVQLNQDDVYQVDLDDLTAGGTFNVRWSGSTHLLVTVYAMNLTNNEMYLYQDPYPPVAGVPSNGPVAFTDNTKYSGGDAWGEAVDITQFHGVNFPANPLFARIRPVGGNAVLDVTGVSDQQLAAKASCTVAGVYREFVRLIPAYQALPAVFDYVLYDRSTAINEF